MYTTSKYSIRILMWNAEPSQRFPDFCWIIKVVLPGQPESGAGGEIPRLDPGCSSFRSRLHPWWEVPLLLWVSFHQIPTTTYSIKPSIGSDVCHPDTLQLMNSRGTCGSESHDSEAR